MEKAVRAIEKDGLSWNTEYKKEPIAFGIFKLVIGAVVEDEKVSTDDIATRIEEFEDLVQSVDIVSFNKLWLLFVEYDTLSAAPKAVIAHKTLLFTITLH